MARRVGIFALMFAASVMSGCTTRGGNIAYNPADFGVPDARPPAADMARRPLSPGDVVTIRVFELAQISGDRTVDGAGRISVPLVGSLPAEGKTLLQFSDELSHALASQYLQSPHVLVTLKEAAQQTLTVDGAVNQPGVYAIAPNATLIQAIAAAKGPTGGANLKRVMIFRKIDGVRQVAAFDVTTIRKGEDPDPIVYPNDLVVVDGTNLATNYRTILRSIPLASFFTRF